jgi:hypothetical protein
MNVTEHCPPPAMGLGEFALATMSQLIAVLLKCGTI